MKILHYIPSIGKSGGGVSAYLQLLSHELGKLVELHIVTHHTHDEITLEHCSVHYIEGNIKHFMRMKHEYCTLLNELKPDLIHVNGCWMLQCSWTIFWAKTKGYPVLLSPHGMLEPWNIKKNYWAKKLPALLLYQKRAIKLANFLVATADTEKKNLIKLGYNKNIAIIPNGIVIDGIAMKKSWEERKQILFLALYRRNKGIDLLMQAIFHMKNDLKDWKVIIAGIESDYTIKDLKRMAEEKGISNIITVTGGLFGDDKWNTYRESDVFVLPTLNENFGIVIAEALLSGTPVITCKGAPWQGIVEHRCGWWVNRTAEDIANAINESLSLSEQELEAMGKRGRNYVIKKFSSNIVAENMKQLYQQIVEKTAIQNANTIISTSESKKIIY